MKTLLLTTLLLMLAVAVSYADPGGAPMFVKAVETDPDSGAQVFLIGGDERPADDIYGEQPYADATSHKIAIRYYRKDDKPGGLSIVDLYDGTRTDVLVGKAPFPAFHAWGEYMYFNQTVDGKYMLRRVNYLTGKQEDVAPLPAEKGRYSYGTVSPDHRYYAVSIVEKDGEPAKVHLLDIKTGQWSVLLDKPGYHAKHEQFSRDGRNRVLIQLNQMPDVKMVLLSELEIGVGEKQFPADQPHTPRPTGHESWIGNTNRVFYSTGKGETAGNIWTCAVDDKTSKLAYSGPLRFGHISVSEDGKYWICDTGEEGIPLYVGSFATGKCKRLCLTKTEYDGQQWAHAHPYMTADNKWVIFSARRNGHPQVYGAKLAEGWLAGLE